MSVKSRRNAKYTLAFLDLLRTPFSQWKAYSKGIIDHTGKTLRKADKSERDEWTRFHKMVATIKQVMNRGSVNAPALSKLHRSMKVIKEQYDVSTCDTELYKEFPMLSEMVSGDAGGSPENIASGTNSGAVVYPGAKTLKKKVKRKMNEVSNFKQFVEGLEADKIANELATQEQEAKLNEMFKFEFKSMGGNSVVVEATLSEVKSMDVSGKTTRDSVTLAGLSEAYKEGKDGIHSYLKESTNLVWKAI